LGQPAQNAGSTGLGGGLFGAKPAQPALGGGLFGSTTQNQGGGGLFGSTNQGQPQQQTSLFGSSAPSGGLGGSLFGGGASTNQQETFQNAKTPLFSGLFHILSNIQRIRSIEHEHDTAQKADCYVHYYQTPRTPAPRMSIYPYRPRNRQTRFPPNSSIV